MKKTFLLLSIYYLLSIATPVLAQTEYQLLEPLPGYVKETSAGKTNASNYISGIFTLMIAIAGGLAVIMIIFGGIKYMSTDAFGEKNEAKNTIQNALWGFLLAISAWLILNTINPNLTKFNLSIPVQSISTTSPVYSSPDLVVPGPSIGLPWQDDSNTRLALIDYSVNIYVKKANCAKIGDYNCTSVANLGSSAVNGIKSLSGNCKCAVTISGGTEYWLHGNRSTEIELNPTDHKPGGNVVDLSFYTGVTNYLRARGTRTTTSGCSNLGSEKYTLNGATYVNEGDHWHTCF